MITTTLAVVALAGTLSAGASPSPSWQSDYPQALAAASAAQKPLAVFLGQDTSKIQQMFSDGTIPAEAAKLLREKYVCVVLTAATGEGKELAGRVQMDEGLVINTPAGSVQALRHTSAVTGPDLTRQLGEFANPGRAAVTTAATPVVAPVAAAPAVTTNVIRTCSGGTCQLSAPTVTYGIPNAAPAASYPAPTYTPNQTFIPAQGTVTPFPVYATGFPVAAPGSSCPNGRCPNQR